MKRMTSPLSRTWLGAEAVGLAWALGMALFTALSFVFYLAGHTDGRATILALALTLGAIILGVRALARIRGTSFDVAPTGEGQGVCNTPLQSDSSETTPGRHRAAVRGSANGTRVSGKAQVVAVIALGGAAAQVAIAAWTAVGAPFSAWDAWSFWALKARMFVLGGPRPGYFRDPLTLYTHPDYPLNVPLAVAAFFHIPGQVGVALAALIDPACLAALLLLFYAGLTRLYGPTMAALAVAALSFVPALATQAASGNADVPLALYIGGAALYLLLWWRLRRPLDAVLMGLLAGGAIWTKKEGLPVAALLLSAYAIGEIRRALLVHRTSRERRLIRNRGALVEAAPTGTARAYSNPPTPWEPTLHQSATGGRQAATASANGPSGGGQGVYNTPLQSDPGEKTLGRVAPVALAALALPLPWLLFCRVVRPLGRDFLPFTPGVFLAHADRLPHIITLFLLQMLDFANWSLLWALLAGLLLLAARRLSPQGYSLLLLLAGQLGVYALSFVFSDWQPYTAHVQTSLDRLLVQALPLALLLLVETVHTLSTARQSADTERTAASSRDAAA